MGWPGSSFGIVGSSEKLRPRFVAYRDANFGTEPAATFKDTQHIRRLAHLKAQQRIQVRDDSVLGGLFRAGRWHGLQSLRGAASAVALAEVRPLFRVGPVVVEGG